MSFIRHLSAQYCQKGELRNPASCHLITLHPFSPMFIFIYLNGRPGSQAPQHQTQESQAVTHLLDQSAWHLSSLAKMFPFYFADRQADRSSRNAHHRFQQFLYCGQNILPTWVFRWQCSNNTILSQDTSNQHQLYQKAELQAPDLLLVRGLGGVW